MLPMIADQRRQHAGLRTTTPQFIHVLVQCSGSRECRGGQRGTRHRPPNGSRRRRSVVVLFATHTRLSAKRVAKLSLHPPLRRPAAPAPPAPRVKLTGNRRHLHFRFNAACVLRESPVHAERSLVWTIWRCSWKARPCRNPPAQMADAAGRQIHGDRRAEPHPRR